METQDRLAKKKIWFFQFTIDNWVIMMPTLSSLVALAFQFTLLTIDSWVVMMPTLLSLVTLAVVMTTTASATSDDKDSIVMTLISQGLYL